MNSSDIAYKKMLEERIKSINESIEKLKKSDERVFALHTQIESRINGLKIEQEKIQKELNEYVKRDELKEKNERVISYYDNKYDKRSEKQEEYQDRINELNNIKQNVSSVHAKKVIDKKIKRLNEKVNDLKKKKGKIVNAQKRIMYPKYKYNLNKQRRLSMQEGKLKNYETLLNDNEIMKQSVNDKSIFASLEKRMYDRRSKKYTRKIEKTKEVIDVMKTKNTRVLGAKTISMKRRVADKIKNRTTTPVTPSPAPAL